MLTSTITPTGGVTVWVRPAFFLNIFVKLNWQMLLPVIIDCMADVIVNYV